MIQIASYIQRRNRANKARLDTFSLGELGADVAQHGVELAVVAVVLEGGLLFPCFGIRPDEQGD